MFNQNYYFFSSFLAKTYKSVSLQEHLHLLEYRIINNKVIFTFENLPRQKIYFFSSASNNPSINHDSVQDLVLHNENDMPASINFSTNKKKWYYKGLLHRNEDLPAIVDSNTEMWYQFGQKHREGYKPAVIEDGHAQFYFLNKRVEENEFMKMCNNINKYKYTENFNNEKYIVYQFLNIKMYTQNDIIKNIDKQPAIFIEDSSIHINNNLLHNKFHPSVYSSRYGDYWFHHANPLSEQEIRQIFISKKISNF
jgi:hypothetical protein